MMLMTVCVVLAISTALATAVPIPGESDLYNSYNGTAAPYPGNQTGPILPTTNGTGYPDDLLFRNLLAAEWVIFSFYQQGVETFTPSNFTKAGYPLSTWSRIAEIRDNEAGHLLIFQNQLSNASIKPGPCSYDYGFGTDVKSYLALQTVIEITSMAFLTGLILQAEEQGSKAALLSIAAVEARHLAWGLIDIWGVDPFGGPAETTFPYANQILGVTKQFVVPNSCPKQNPIYPYPPQNLPQLDHAASPTPVAPGSNITFTYANASHVPAFKSGHTYYAVFFHGLVNISVEFDTQTNSSVVPKEFDNKGIILAVIADTEGAPQMESVVAGPLIILLQPPLPIPV